MATDVPFWRRSTGAEQRINSLVSHLDSKSFNVRTFYLGQTGSSQFTETDQDLIKKLNLDVEQKSSDQPPENWLHKIGWYAEATLNQISNWKTDQANESDSPTASPDQPQPLKLNDFRWPWAISAFKESLKKFQPDTILIQYIKLGYLLESLSPNDREKIRCVIDTHDVLYQRNERFKQNGFSHWIDIDRSEEANAIKQFDVALAIQPEEAKTFCEMAPTVNTVVCGHATTVDLTGTSSGRSPKGPATPLRVGYLGSKNASNVEAIKKLLVEASEFQFQNEVEFVIAGAVSDVISDSIPPKIQDRVTLLGTIEELQELYSQIDIAINPVEFGTGLKIKNAESLSFGIPLITSAHGAEGMEIESTNAVVICNSMHHFCCELNAFATDAEKFESFQDSAQKFATMMSVSNPENVYAEFVRLLAASSD